MQDRLAWGIMGTGGIAHRFAGALAKSKTGRLVAVGSRAKRVERSLRREYGIERRHAGYEACSRIRKSRRCISRLRTRCTPNGRSSRGCRQACSLRKAARAELSRCDGRRRGRSPEQRLPHGSLHVPLPSADRAARRVDPLEGHRRSARHPGRVQLLPHREKRAASSAMRSAAAGFSMSAATASRWRAYRRRRAGKEFAEPVELTGCAKLHETTGVDEWAIVPP